MLMRLGGIPVYRTEAKGHIKSAIEEFSKLDKFIIVLTPEGGTYAVSQFRSGFYYIAKDMNIPYVPIEIDFKNRSFNIQDPHFISGTFEEESEKLEKLFEGVEGATRKFTMLKEKE
jgi:1-acyl-sn-glycerol-3-phosphate acyltransferase